MPTPPDYDLIVIGSGPGGAALAHRLAPTGKRILILERGDYLPREEANWSAQAVFVEGRYQADETWVTKDGSDFHPQLHYVVGGNSKVYGAALFRLRERDFEEVRHHGGVSPAWPLSYTDFAPWYDEAEALFHVHGRRGEDPLDPGRVAYPYVPVTHEPKVQELSDKLSGIGLHPFHLPLGILLHQKEDGFATPTSTCMRCSFFDGFPCLLNGKADAQVMCVDPMLRDHPNVMLMTGAYAERLETDASGRRVEQVVVTREGREERYTAGTVVVACGSLSSSLLLLRSASERHPNGLANGSDQVGRNYMRHEMSIVMAVMTHVNETVFQKTLALSDFYFESGDAEFAWPLGLIQMCATSHAEQIKGEVSLAGLMKHLPDMPFAEMARHSMDFWLQSEDLPIPENRVYYEGDRVHLDVSETNAEALKRLKAKLKQVLSDIGWPAVLVERSLYLGKDIPLSGTAHQAGTCRFGTDPATSVLDLDCRAHEVDNLYITDASFFPSIGAVNPTLTIIANALRVASIIEGTAVTTAAVVALIVRYGTVTLFLPFSALDKVFSFDHAVEQAQQVFTPRPLAIAVLMAGLFIEVVCTLGVVTGIADRAAALVIAAYCAATAVLYKQFWRQGDFANPGGKARGLFWDFLKNLSLGAGFLLLVVNTDGSGLQPFLDSPFASSHPYGR